MITMSLGVTLRDDTTPRSHATLSVWCLLQNGELQPGSKGLSMNREQWQKLVAGMDSLTAQLS
jgi:hypothetical protein